MQISRDNVGFHPYSVQGHSWSYIRLLVGLPCHIKSSQGQAVANDHRYPMGRLLLHAFSLWRHVFSTAPPFTSILWWWKYEILFPPFPRNSSSLGGQRWQPIQMGHSLHIRGRGRGLSRYYYRVYANDRITPPSVVIAGVCSPLGRRRAPSFLAGRTSSVSYPEIPVTSSSVDLRWIASGCGKVTVHEFHRLSYTVYLRCRPYFCPSVIRQK
jgi:hypothetical protein